MWLRDLCIDGPSGVRDASSFLFLSNNGARALLRPAAVLFSRHMAPLVRLAAPLAWAALALAAPGAKQPNIIWLLTDDMDLHGYQVMPNLQAELLGEGMEFTNSFVASPKCCPSRTSALSGRFPHGMDAASLGWCGNFATDWENRTFFVGLQQAGYTTAAIGKFFNQEPSFCGANIHVPHGLDDCFLMCEEVKYYNITYNDNGKMVSTGDAPTDYLTSVLGNRSLEFVRTATGAGQPFFMYLAVHAPHLPAIPAPWYANASVPTRAPRDPNWNTGTEGKHWQVATNGPMGDFYIAASDALFGDRLRTLLSVDDIVGDLVAELRAAGELDNTYIVFSSDHGYHNGQYRLWAEKSQIYDSDTRIPFLVRGPGVPAGSKNDALVSPIDVGATLLELAGAVAPGSRTTDGRSFVALLQSTVPAAAAAVEPAPAVAAAWPRDRVLIEFPG